MSKPTLILVSGRPGAGKTTLAHLIARAIPCPAICRDEIKEGMVRARGGPPPTWGDEVSHRTVATFHAVVKMLLERGVTVVAEAAFRDRLWEAELDELTQMAQIRIVHCVVSAEVARERYARRAWDPSRDAHPDAYIIEAFDNGTLSWDDFEAIASAGPCIRVETTDGYTPPLKEIVAFINR